MKTPINKILLGISIIGSLAIADELMLGTTGATSWTDPDHLGIYWLDIDGSDIGRGYNVRSSSDATGVANQMNEDFNRVTGVWTENAEYYLDTSDGTWHSNIGSVDYAVTTTDEENDTVSVVDGKLKLTGTDDISGQWRMFSECFDINVTFSNGALEYQTSWQPTDYYGLLDTIRNWANNESPYASLSDFVDAHVPFLWNEATQENAGFRLNAALSDGSGDLVVITYDASGNPSEGRVVGSWDANYTLPGQSANSIKFEYDDESFAYDDGSEFEYATMFDNVVWMGGHYGASISWYPMEGSFIGNETAYNDYMNAMAPYDFSKVVTCDVKDKEVDLITEDNRHLRFFYYGNMNYTGQIEVSQGQWSALPSGIWSVENGTVIRDRVLYDVNKSVDTVQIDLSTLKSKRTLTGRGDLIVTKGQLTQPPSQFTQTNIPTPISSGTLQGKKINLTYQEAGSDPVTDDFFFYPNMTFSGKTEENVGVWKVENGVLVLDAYWVNPNNQVETGVESWVFTDSTHALVYVDNQVDANVTINSIDPIQSTDNYPASFTTDPVNYPFTVESMADKVVVIGDPNDPANQDTIYFNADMTYKQETHDNEGNPETITGAWSVEEGAIIVDVVYDDYNSANFVITYNGDGTIRFMEIVANATTRDDSVQIISMEDIPHGVPHMPAVIMYLFN